MGQLGYYYEMFHDMRCRRRYLWGKHLTTPHWQQAMAMSSQVRYWKGRSSKSKQAMNVNMT